VAGLNEFPKVPDAGGVTEVTVVGERTKGAALAPDEIARAAADAAATSRVRIKDLRL